MTAFVLECTGCGRREKAAFFAGCQACGSSLHVVSPAEPPGVADAPGIWKDLGALGTDGLRPASLDEGTTPLVRGIGGRANHHVKFEGGNPTGSWKDRLQSVNATVARALGLRGLSVVSTGNSALAAAAYANRAGLDLRARLSPRAPRTIIDAIRAFGFEVEIEAAGAPPPDLHRDLVVDRLFPATMSLPECDVANPFGLEGYKTIAYEIARQLGRIPDWVSVPVGCGDGLFGISKGFAELAAWGAATTRPRLLGVQSDQAAPLVAAVHDGSSTTTPVVVGHTVALSIAVDTAGNHALGAIRDSKGSAIAVSDAEIEAAQAGLSREGISAEASSAAAWAGVTAAIDNGIIGPDEIVVAVVTSNGFRWIS